MRMTFLEYLEDEKWTTTGEPRYKTNYEWHLRELEKEYGDCIEVYPYDTLVDALLGIERDIPYLLELVARRWCLADGNLEGEVNWNINLENPMESEFSGMPKKYESLIRKTPFPKMKEVERSLDSDIDLGYMLELE